MSAFTINAGGTVLWDSLSGGSVNATLDTYAISNGTTLKIDTDSYQCANHSSASGSLDSVSFSGIGGKLLLDGTTVRVIPFNTGSGAVPAIGTSITQGGVSGPLLGVWANWQSEPLAAAAAMPTSGFIKVRSVSGGAFAAGALGGISANATGADVVGWIEVRGADTASVIAPRIGAVEVTGDWFELGTTNGSRGQVLACPTTATVAGVFPGVWIETSSGSGVYERFAGAGSIVALATIPTDERGKIVWQTTSGIRIGSDGTNNVGYLPPTGCKVRIPNVIMTCCTRTAGNGSGPRVLPNATLSTRQEFVMTGAGTVSIDKAVLEWNGSFVQAFDVNITNTAICTTLLLQEIASQFNVDNVIVGATQAQAALALCMLSCFAGGEVQNCRFARFSLSSTTSYVVDTRYNKGINYTNVTYQSLLNRGNTSAAAWYGVQGTSCTWTNCTGIGGRHTQIGSRDCTFTNHHHIDQFSGSTIATYPCSCFEFTTGCNGMMIDGLDFGGIANVHPYNALIAPNASYNITLRNVGSYASPLSLGSANNTAYIFDAAGNNDGIRVQRVYVSSTRTGAWIALNSDNNFTLESVKADYADTSVLTALNMIAKGVSLTGSTAGQTSVYGTHFKDSFISATVGKIELLCNEPTAQTVAYVQETGGTPRWSSAGSVALTTIGDQVTWEMPYFAKGHTSLANLAITLTGTNTGNLTYEFQYDFGSGYNGTWLTLNATNLSGAGAITPSTGVRLKVRATCATANAGNVLMNINIPTVTNSTDQNQTYPLDTNTVTFTGLPTGTDVVVLTAGTATILAQQDAGAGTTYAFTFSGAQTIDVGFIKTGYVPLYIRNLSLTAVDSTIPVAMVPDRNFS